MNKLWGRLLCGLGFHKWDTQHVYSGDFPTLLCSKVKVYFHRNCERCGRLDWPSFDP